MGSKKFFMLAMTAVLLLGLSSAAFAQSRFVVSSSPLQERQTGVTETIGDILLTSSDPSPMPTIPAGTNLTVSIIPASATITNNPVVNGDAPVGPPGRSGNLYIETPPAFAPMPIPGATLAVGTGPLSNTLIISFAGPPAMPVPVPLNTRLRIRGIRVNDQASGLTFPAQIQAQLNVTPPDAMRFDNVSTVAVSTPLPTLGISFPQPPGQLLQCLGGSQGTLTRRIVITEQFSAVFTSQDQETGLSATPPPTNTTRIEVLLNNVPGGLTVMAPITVDLITTPPVSPAAFLVRNDALSQISLLTSAMTRNISLIYDVTGTPDLGQIEHTPSLAASDAMFRGFDFTFITAGSISNQALGSVTAQVRLAPVSATPARCAPGAPPPACVIPRFVDPFVPAMPQSLFGVVACNCHLKFPFVTNQAGFDTGIAIANTTMDPYGTAGQSGTITLFFFGAGAPMGGRTNITPALTSGSTFAQTLSSLAPGFQGYVIAIANFQFCEGFAFIADRAFANIAHGYTALVIPDPVQVGPLLGSSTQQRIPGFVTTGSFSININPMTGAGTGTITITDGLGERLLQ